MNPTHRCACAVRGCLSLSAALLSGSAFLMMPAAHADLSPQAAPAGNFDLSHWKLGLPVDAQGGHTGVAAEVSPQTLTAGSGYSSQWFYTASDGGMAFQAYVNGATTKGSDTARSELREVIDPNRDSVNWSIDGKSVLDARLKVSTVPSANGKLVVGQIHGYNTPPLVKLRYQYSASSKTGRIDALIHSSPSAASDISLPLATNIALNQPFYYHVTVVNGVLSMSVNSATPTRMTIDKSWRSTGFYFKAGNYLQANGSSSADGGRVTFYRLAASHPDNGLVIVTPELARATAGTPYAQPLNSGSGAGNVVWSLVSGRLPAGLGIARGTGWITGTPAAGTADGRAHSFSVLVRDAVGDTAAKTYSLAIDPPQ